MKKFSFGANVWVWPGVGGLHFVNLPKDLSKEVKASGKHYGAGFMKVKVTVGKSTWVTALFPQKVSESYLLSIKKSIRKKEEIVEGDKVRFVFTLVK